MTSGPAAGFASTGTRNHPGHADQRSHGRRGGTPEQLLNDDAAIRDTFEYHDEKTGMRATVTEIVHDRFSTEAHIAITDRSGNTVGRAIRTVRADQKEVRHDVLGLEPGVQGQGFATRLNAHAEESYRAYGIERVTANANIDVGGFSHARAGYDFADANARAEVKVHITMKMMRGSGDYSDAVRAEIGRALGNPHASPIDFAMIGHTPGATTWPGKELMLGSTWEAVKTL